MALAKKIGTGAIIAAGFAGVNALKQKVTYPTPPAFYDPASVTGSGEPGEIVRVEAIPWTMRTLGWRMLYRSTDRLGKLSIVSGLLVAPAGIPPDGGWPVVAVSHGTAGLPRGAAPSMTIDANSDETTYVYANNIKPFVDAGYAVAFTDYQGWARQANTPIWSGQSKRPMCSTACGRSGVSLGSRCRIAWSSGGIRKGAMRRPSRSSKLRVMPRS